MEAALPRSTLSLLERLSEHHKCVFREEVLARLSVKDRLFLARTSHELRAAVLTSGLPIVGDGRRRITMSRTWRNCESVSSMDSSFMVACVTQQKVLCK